MNLFLDGTFNERMNIDYERQNDTNRERSPFINVLGVFMNDIRKISLKYLENSSELRNEEKKLSGGARIVS